MSRDRLRAGLAWVIAIALLSAAPSKTSLAQATDADDAGRQLRSIETEVQQSQSERKRLQTLARTLDAELGKVRAALVRVAREAQGREQTLSMVETKLTALQLQAESRRGQLGAKRARLIKVADALHRLAKRPARYLLATRTPPVEAARAAILLRSTVPAMAREAKDLRAEIAEIEGLNRDIRDQRTRLQQASTALTKERLQLSALLARKAKLRKRTQGQSQELEQQLRDLAGSANTLKQLVQILKRSQANRNREADRLEEMLRSDTKPSRQSPMPSLTEPTAPPRPSVRNQTRSTATQPPTAQPEFIARLPDAPSIKANKGRLAFPASGRVAERYGQRDDSGFTAKGITLATRPGAQVVAPFDGIVAFAGPFRSFGNILIIDHGEGYHTLLAGLGRIDLTVGQGLLAGEPVGIMTEGNKQEVNGDRNRLYVELRHAGEPINPIPWFSKRTNKVNR